jgi:uncharacterized DUF497 family protein
LDYDFGWDPKKAAGNRKKHRAAFEQAATVFKDPRALSIYDAQHSATEDRWITLGISESSGLLVVHHTFQETDANSVRIRIYSSRKATKGEVSQYVER